MLKRSRLSRKPGRKAQREAPALAIFRDAVASRYWCEAGGLLADGVPVCSSAAHRGVEAHHVWPEDRDRGVHDPERGLWLCARAHRWAHDHPKLASVAGLLRPR